VVDEFRERLEALARRPGWFPTVGELLDWMRAQGEDDRLSPAEWQRMQFIWARDLLRRKVRELCARGAAVVIIDTFWPKLRRRQTTAVRERRTPWSVRT
jgi:hypothetical protein